MTEQKHQYPPPEFIGARVVQVIETSFDVAGEGTKENPLRKMIRYWTLDGRLIATIDPHIANMQREAEEKRPRPALVGKEK